MKLKESKFRNQESYISNKDTFTSLKAIQWQVISLYMSLKAI